MTPHLRVSSGSFSVVNWQRSIASASWLPVSPVKSARLLQSGGATTSLLAGSQSSSTLLPMNSNAPGLTSGGSEHWNMLSQQSLSQSVQPSPSTSAMSSGAPLQSSSTLLSHSSSVGVT